jgi:hypothetical protein
MNNYLRTFLRKKPDGMIIHPEYSTFIEECSELAVEGKTMRLRIAKTENEKKSDE